MQDALKNTAAHIQYIQWPQKVHEDKSQTRYFK